MGKNRVKKEKQTDIKKTLVEFVKPEEDLSISQEEAIDIEISKLENKLKKLKEVQVVTEENKKKKTLEEQEEELKDIKRELMASLERVHKLEEWYESFSKLKVEKESKLKDELKVKEENMKENVSSRDQESKEIETQKERE